MKRRIILFLAILLQVNTLTFAQDFTALLENTKTEYDLKHYETAISQYDSLIQLGVNDAVVYYNIGNCYFKIKEYAKARLYYEKALLLLPTDEDIKHNIEVCKAMQVDKINEIGQGFFSEWFTAFYRKNSVDTWAVYSIIAFLFIAFGVYLYLSSEDVKSKKIGFYSAIFALALFITSFISAKQLYNEQTKQQYAIIIEPTVSLKSEPNFNSQDVTVIHSGIKIKILHQLDTWLFISLPDGNKAWILKDYIEEI